jgi:hypothetical protein
MRRRRIVTAALAVVVGGGVLLAGGAGAATSARPAATILLRAQAMTPRTVAGGMAQVAISVSNDGRVGGAVAAPLSLALDPSAGLTYAGMTSSAALGAGSSARISCRPAGARGAACAVSGRLAPGAAVSFLTRFRVASAIRTATVLVRGGGAAAGRRSHASIKVVAGTPAPRLLVGFESAPARAGRPVVAHVHLVDIGSGPAAGVQLTNLLPPGLAASVRASGAGWTCSATAGTACSTAATIAAGGVAAPLTIVYRLDPAALTKLGLRPGDNPAVQRWSLVAATAGTTSSNPSELVVMPEPAAQLAVTAVAAGGRLELLPGASSTVRVQVKNLGEGTTDGPLALDLAVPRGMSVTSVTSPAGRFDCAGSPAPAQGLECHTTAPVSVAPRKSLAVTLAVHVDADAAPAQGILGVAAAVPNESVRTKPRATGLPFQILEANVGFPSLVLLRTTSKAPLALVTDGSAAQLLSGQVLTERLDVRNAGGAELATGSRIVLTQQLGRGSSTRSIAAPSGWTCSGGARLACTLSLRAAVSIGGVVEGPTVKIAAGTASSRPQVWTATVALSPAGRTRASRLPVAVSVTQGAVALVPDLRNRVVPTAGGTGVFGLTVRNEGNIATVDPVRVGVKLPHGARLAEIHGAGWSCVPAPSRTSALCTAAAQLAAGKRAPALALSAHFGAHSGGKPVVLAVHASDGARRAARAATATIETVPRPALRAVIRRTVDEVSADHPQVTLEGDGSGGSGLAVGYHWRQRCTTAADAAEAGSHCASTTPAVTWLSSRSQADVELAVPRVSAPATLVFELEVGDGSAHAVAVERLRVIPAHGAGNAGSVRVKKATAGLEPAETVTVAPRRLPPAAKKLVAAPPKKAPVAHQSTAVGATTTTSTTTTTTTTTTDGATTTVPAVALPSAFCHLVTQAGASASFSSSLGGTTIAFAGAQITGKGCAPDTVVHFSGASFTVRGFLHATNVSGTVTPARVSFSGGTLHAPEAWRAPAFPVSGLAIPFSGTPALTGSVQQEGGMPFLWLEGAWNGTTTLTFTGAADGTHVSVSATAAGPLSEHAVTAPRPQATVEGTVGDDGTFSLRLQVQRLVQLHGVALDVTGTVKRAEPSGEIVAHATGALAAPAKLVAGLNIDTLAVSFAPTEKSSGLDGSGAISLSYGSNRGVIPFSLRYTDPANWALVVTGAGGESLWEPVPGMVADSREFAGSIVAKDDILAIDLQAHLRRPWNPTPGVHAKNLDLTLHAGCPNIGLGCRKLASVYLEIDSDVTVTLPGAPSANLKLHGALAYPDGEFRVVVSLDGSIGVGAGITIDRPSVVIQRGVPMPPEQPSTAVQGSGIDVEVTGGVTLPKLGSLPIVHASISNGRWAIAAPVGSLTLPDGSKIANTVVAWSSYATTLKVLDRTKNAPRTIDVPSNVFVVAGDLTVPSWARTLLALPASATATGRWDTAANTFALEGTVPVAGRPYIYGRDGSAVGIRADAVSFRTGSEGLRLSGTATLQVAGGNKLAQSTAQLQLSLGLDARTNTVGGALTLTNASGWNDAFGVQGLVLHSLVLQANFRLPALVPELGFAADAVLPADVRSGLGIAGGARTKVVANLSITNPCLGVEVYDPAGSGRDVVNLGSGAVTARSLELWFAPSGCTVGKYRYLAGASVKFDGKVVGIPLALEATLTRAPFSFEGRVDIGEIPVGGLTVKRTRIDVSLAANRTHVTFSGGVNILGTNVDVTGRVVQQGQTATFDLTGRLDKLAIAQDVLTANDLVFAMQIQSGQRNSLFVSASGKASLLGSTIDARFALTMLDGKLDRLQGDLAARIAIGGSSGLVLDGTFKVDIDGKRKKIDGIVTASVGSFRLNKTTIVVQEGWIQIESRFTYGSVFNADISGAAYVRVPAGATTRLPDGRIVPAKQGDFYLAASNVGVKLGPFNGAGDVWLGHADGNVGARLNAAVQVTGSGASNTVRVAGVIDGATQNFKLNGVSKLDLAGFTQEVQVTIEKSGAAVRALASASMGLLGSKQTLEGEFFLDPTGFHFKLGAKANLTLGSYSLVGAQVHFSNLPGEAGLWATARVNIGGVVDTGDVRLSIEPGGRFFLQAGSTVDLKVLKVGATVTFANHFPSCVVQSIDFSRGIFNLRFVMACTEKDSPPTLIAESDFKLWIYSARARIAIGADGSFQASYRSPGSGIWATDTPTVSFFVVRGYAELHYALQLDINSRRSPAVEFTGSGGASINVAYWTFWSGWSGWYNLISGDFELRANPFRACGWVRVVGQDVGGCIP